MNVPDEWKLTLDDVMFKATFRFKTVYVKLNETQAGNLALIEERWPKSNVEIVKKVFKGKTYMHAHVTHDVPQGGLQITQRQLCLDTFHNGRFDL